MLKTLLLSLLTVLQASVSYCDDAKEKGKELLEYSALAEEFSLEDYVMGVDVTVETTPDSEILFSSTGHFEVLKQKDKQLAYVNWKANIVDDSRQGRKKQAINPFAWNEEILYVTRGQTEYFLGADKGFRVLNKKSPIGPYHGVVLPFSWPVHTLQTFQRMHGGVGGLKELLANQICFQAREDNGILESYWTVPSKAIGFSRLRSKDNLLLQYDLILRDKASVPEEVDVDDKNNTVLASVKTKWTRFGDADVPNEVRSMLLKKSATAATEYHIVAKLQFHASESEIYSKMLIQLTEFEAQIDRQKSELLKPGD